MRRRDIGDSEPLRFIIYAIKRLITGIREREKTIGAFLNRGGAGGECHRRDSERKNSEQDFAEQPGERLHAAKLTFLPRSAEALIPSISGVERPDRGEKNCRASGRTGATLSMGGIFPTTRRLRSRRWPQTGALELP
jgi:hypothetical protein